MESIGLFLVGAVIGIIIFNMIMNRKKKAQKSSGKGGSVGPFKNDENKDDSNPVDVFKDAD